MFSIPRPIFSSFFLAALYPIHALPLSSLIAIACQRNPSLAICTNLHENSNFRAKDTVEGIDTQYMRGFPHISFEKLQAMRYCANHISKYEQYCANNGQLEFGLKTKLLKFCPSFEKHCSQEASKIVADSLEYKPKLFFLVVPPSLPTAPAASETEPVQFDLPLASAAAKDALYGVGIKTVAQMSPSMIRTCTPNCTALHCTVECKCHASHQAVNAKCNPPANGEIASTCQAWYSKCGRWFSPLQY